MTKQLAVSKPFKTLVAISIMILIIGLLASCGKYDDGPSLSLRTKKARLKGTWLVIESDSYNKTYTFSKNGDATVTFEYYDGAGNADGTEYQSKTWDFTNSKEFLTMYDADGDNYRTYKITRLTKKELWIEGSEYSNELLKWEKQKD